MEQPNWSSEHALFGPNDLPSHEIINADAKQPLLLVGDHSSNKIPAGLNQLGLEADSLDRHIAYDKGTRPLLRELAGRLGYRTVLCNYSRLVVDCNRHVNDPSVILAVSDQTSIPGNHYLADEQRNLRITSIYNEYHGAVKSGLDSLQQHFVAPGLIAVHSFTPRLIGEEERPWHVGILWDKDERLALPLLDYFNSIEGLYVGDNHPYSGKHPADYTIDHHGEGRGLPCVSIEIRQNLLDTELGVQIWADRLCEIFLKIQRQDQLFESLRADMEQ